MLWQHYVLRRAQEVHPTWEMLFERRKVRLLYIAGCGFDVRAQIVMKEFVQGLRESRAEIEDARLLLIGFSGYRLDDELRDVVGRFIRERLSFSPSGCTASEDLRLAYNQFVTDIGQPDTFVEMNPLQRRLKAYPGVASGPKRINGVVRRVWTGITVREDVTDVTL